MTIIETVNRTAEKLLKVSTTPKLDSEILISHILKEKNRLNLYLNNKSNLNISQKKEFDKLISQRLNHKPIAKIINSKSFWNFDLDVSKKVLIPRPETEILIDLVCKNYQKNKRISFLDIGCGSGCISLALLENFKYSNGLAIDVSKQAVENTFINFNRYFNKNNLKIKRQNIFKFKTNKMFDLIISNPPYLKPYEFCSLSRSIKSFEPKEALISNDKNGIMFYKKIIKDFKKNLKLNGLVAFEIGNNQFGEIKKLLDLNGFWIQDYYRLIDNQVRCLIAKKIKN